MNLEVPVNEDPLNAVEEDMPEEPNDNIYRDSQELFVDEEDMADSFLNLDPIQDLEMSSESSKRRGIWVLWNNNNCHASVLAKDNRAIHMLVHDPGNANNIIGSGIYGPTQARDKDAFWKHLVRMNSVIDLPWLLVGDFNELESLIDKQGGTSPSVQRIERLNSFLTTIRAKSILVKGESRA
ncbi:hypothetical protein Cgig2_014181 [Carnegiea gigantea]|uniref:Uncharacterized protein n=1 Tax=Carnegiea gigantea TaxID=171969 RepID=A0A9Q1K7E5_9CARY|nr:hypothetical protein Cgig2_014181 [Carnegiea gigantea]